MVYITNGSHRPIRDITGAMVPKPGMDSVAADQIANVVTASVGGSQPASAILKINVPAIALLRAGKAAGLVFPYPIDEYPKPRFTIEFTDDAGLRWQIDSDLHLQKLPGLLRPRTWAGVLELPGR